MDYLKMASEMGFLFDQLFRSKFSTLFNFVENQPLVREPETYSYPNDETISKYEKLKENVLHTAPWEFKRIFVSLPANQLNYAGTIKKYFPALNLPNNQERFSQFSPSLIGYRLFRVFDLWLTSASGLDLVKAVNIADEECSKLSKLSNSNSNAQLVFSSDPWDILTMSSRGIRSCMSFDNACCSHLIGSIIDPGCAIIYLTNGVGEKFLRFNEGLLDGPKHKAPFCLGEKMLARSLVRFIYFGEKQEPGLFLEKVYFNPHLTNNSFGMISDWMLKAFQNYLKKFTTLPVFLQPPELAVLPRFPGFDSLPKECLSYVDSKVPYNSNG